MDSFVYEYIGQIVVWGGVVGVLCGIIAYFCCVWQKLNDLEDELEDIKDLLRADNKENEGEDAE